MTSNFQLNTIQLLLVLYKKTTSALLTSTCFRLLATSPIAEAISFFDPIGGQLDMGEYLAENAYGFLPVPIEIT